ncbi:MAG: hypothetical protein J0M12_01635 [Deltaproteobacteria bacterium]|nr:hypothetical protein [Deltaproteobacteria bacterium]
MLNRITLVLAVLTLCLLPGLSEAQGKKAAKSNKAPKNAAPAAQKKEPIQKSETKSSSLPLGTSPDFGKLPTYIKSDSLQLKQSERYFIYSGNVEVRHGDMTITSNTVEGSYDEQNKLKKLFAKTNVLIVKGDGIRGTGELATYDADQNTVTLSDNPELSQNGSVLTADSIKIFLKDNRSEATGQVRVKMIDKNINTDLLGKAGKS